MKRIIFILLAAFMLTSCREKEIKGRIIERGVSSDWVQVIPTGKTAIPVFHDGKPYFIVKTDSCSYKVTVSIELYGEYSIGDSLAIVTRKYERVK